MTAFLLVTASRLHTPQNTAHIIEAGLAEGWRYLGGGDGVVLIHGAQGRYDAAGNVLSGGDAIAAELWKRRGYEDDPHPADWSGPCDPEWPGCKPGHRRTRNGRQYCPLAGFRRNQEQVDVLAEWKQRGRRVLCIGFPMPGQKSGGTHDCMRRSKAAGISTWKRWDPRVSSA